MYLYLCVTDIQVISDANEKFWKVTKNINHLLPINWGVIKKIVVKRNFANWIEAKEKRFVSNWTCFYTNIYDFYINTYKHTYVALVYTDMHYVLLQQIMAMKISMWKLEQQLWSQHKL